MNKYWDAENDLNEPDHVDAEDAAEEAHEARIFSND